MNKLLRYSMLWMLALISAATNAVVIDFTQLSITETTTGFTLEKSVNEIIRIIKESIAKNSNFFAFAKLVLSLPF